MYDLGQGVGKDEKKEVYHLEVAAIGGYVQARHNLGCHEEINGRMERAVKHFIIAASMGHEGSMKVLWKCYAVGLVKKEALTATLHTHQDAIDATKSPQREQAEEFLKTKEKLKKPRENKATRFMSRRS
jgi:TPR repeat protein